MTTPFWVLGRLLLLALAAGGKTVTVNYGYFHEPGAHLWSYAVDAHSWTDPSSNTTFNYTFWPQTSGAKVIKKLQSGELDIAHLGSAPYATGALRGVPMSMLYLINLKDLSQCLVARKGLDTPLSLRGMRVAYIGGSTTHFMLSGMLLATGIASADFDWIGHMESADQIEAWDKGEIDAGFMWGGGMWHLQDSPWCSRPDPSSPRYRPCAPEAVGIKGHNLFTSSMSKMWGREVWTNLAVANAFASVYPQAVFRSVKVVATIDTKMVLDPGFFTNSPDRMCGIVLSVDRACTEENYRVWAQALFWDSFLTAEVQASGKYIGEQVPGECAREEIGQFPNNGGPCKPDTVAGSALSAWAAGDFAYQLKSIGYLPSLRYFQSLMDSRYIDAAADPSKDHFPGITAESLALQYPTAPTPQANPAHSFCGDLSQPIRLLSPGLLQDHEGGGFHQDAKRCDWQIDAGQPVLLDNIIVRVERDADKVFIFEGLCGGAEDCSGHRLLAFFTGGKGMGPHTLHNVNPRPPVLAPLGQVTVSFVPDATADRALAVVVDDGLSLEWLPVSGSCPLPCQNGGTCHQGQCHCSGGWGGADCSFPSCQGTLQLAAGATPSVVMSGVPGRPSAHNADCRWEISSSMADWVLVAEIQLLDLDWGFDPLEFFDGIGLAGPKLGSYSGYFTPKLNATLGDRCPGPACPEYVVSNSSSMTVRWTSDAMDSGEGFHVQYYAALRSDVICGPGLLANCAGHGTCSPTGCICDENWYGQFCQLAQCSGQALLAPAASGRIQNMAQGLEGYAPNRDCSWVLRAPAINGSEAGAMAVFVELFDLEAGEPSTDSLSLATREGSSTVLLTGSSGPCVALQENRSGCQPYVLSGSEVTVRFTSDANDSPPGVGHKGFRLFFEAVYDCPRGSDGRCVALSDCAWLGMVPGRTACTPCPPHLHFDQQSSSCRACSQGLVPTEDQMACDFCPEGRVVEEPSRTSCISCPLGKFAPSRGMTRCQDCEPGTFTNKTESVSCMAASKGHFVNGSGAAQDVPCPAGSVAKVEGLRECVLCHPGTSQSQTGQSECERCSQGTFGGVGAAVCTPCPGSTDLDRLIRMTTRETGTADVTQCGCPEGSYRDGQPNSTDCHPCKEGMFCDFGSDAQVFAPGGCQRTLCVAPVTEQGFMTLPGEPFSVFLCSSRERCPGGLPGACARNLAGRACQHCIAGYEWDGKECIECNRVLKGSLVFPMIPVLLIPIVVLVFYKLFGDTIDRWGSWQNGCASLLFILLNHFQIVTIFRGVNMEIPLAVGSSLAFLSMSSDFTGLFRPECTSYARFQNAVVLKACGPFIVFAMFIGVWCTSQCIAKYAKRPWLAMETNRTINAFLSIIFAFFGAIVEMAFALFKCAPNPNGLSSLLTDRSVLCGSEEWNGMIVVGVCAVLLWCVGFAAVLARTIFFAPDWFADEGVQMRWKFLFIKYRSDVHWWALIIILKAILLQQGQLFLDTGVHQLMYLMTVLLMYAVTVTIFRPWRHVLVNFVDGWAHLCMLMSAGSMLTFAEDRLTDAESEALSEQMSVVSLAWLFLVLPLALVVLLAMIWFQSSKRGKRVMSNTFIMVESFFAMVRVAEQQELSDTLRKVGEMDLWFFRRSAKILLAELGARRSRDRLTSSIASPTASLVLASYSDISEKSKKGQNEEPTFVTPSSEIDFITLPPPAEHRLVSHQKTRKARDEALLTEEQTENTGEFTMRSCSEDIKTKSEDRI